MIMTSFLSFAGVEITPIYFANAPNKFLLFSELICIATFISYFLISKLFFQTFE